METQRTIIEKINELGKRNEPFFLIVDFLKTTYYLHSIDSLLNEEIEVLFPTFKNREAQQNTALKIVSKKALSLEEYKKGFDIVKKNLQYGNSYLTNLTAQTPIEINENLQTVFDTAHAKYKIKYKEEWVCFSPETFINIEDGKIYSYPMKGTIDASLPNAMELILNDEKEKAEHFTIVDLIRNDLSEVATNIRVEEFRYIDEIKTNTKNLLQVSSKIVGDLPTNYLQHLGELLFKLLPAGSISGAPKQKTIEIIQEAENYNRGFYTGTAFYFDGKNIDSCVLIRFIEKTKNGLVYKSGGGITINSELEKEYQELIDKIYVPII